MRIIRNSTLPQRRACKRYLVSGGAGLSALAANPDVMTKRLRFPAPEKQAS
jgi:hypothetical protein